MQRYYFPFVTLLLLILTLVAFSDNLFTDTDQPSNSDPKMIVHGLLCGVWTVILFIQSCLVSTRNVRLHRTLGLGGFLVAIGVTLSTIWLFVAIWKGWAAMSIEVQANRLLLPSYSLFVALAFVQRRRSDWHRRLILTGTFFMLEPVLARCFDPAVVPFMVGWTEAQIESSYMPWLFSVWTAFFLSLFAYDLTVARRLHPVTVFAPSWFGIIWLIVSFV